MARTIRDAKLETRAARDRLRTGQTPHFKTLLPGRLHLGYRKKSKTLPGQWLVRHYVGAERYRVAPLGLADDFQDVPDDPGFVTQDTVVVMNYAEAQRRALAHKVTAKIVSRGALTVADAVAAYVEGVREGDGVDGVMGRPVAAAEAERTAAKLILPTLGKIRIADLTDDGIIAWRNALAKEPARLRTKKGEKQNFKAAAKTKDAVRARRATVNRVLTILKAALNAAVGPARKDGITLDPIAWQSVKPFEKVEAARKRFLTVAEAKRVINAADPDSGFRNLVRAALTTGCRYGELCALDVCDFKGRKVHVRDSKTDTPRDVALTDEGVVFFEQLTAGRGGDEIMLRNRGRVARALERERKRCERLRKQGKTAENAKIEDDGRWHKSEQARPMREACRSAKIVPAMGFHQLRHTYASLCVAAEMPLMVLARNLGHASTAMCERHYISVHEDFVDKMIRAGAPTFDFVEDKKLVVLPR